ncbi:MAG: GNAT family N-acetyltransferase [Steroidobacteraceae bacterium]
MHGDLPVPGAVLALRSWECLHESRVVGHCTANTTTGEIIGLSVDHGFRRQSIARRLLSRIVELLRAQGAGRTWLAAPCDATLPAHRFYRALGWRPTGELQGGTDEILEFPIGGAAIHL